MQRHQGSNIAAETVHDSRPLFQCLNLVGTKIVVAIVQINHIRPVSNPVSETAVWLVEEPFGVMLRQPGIRGGVVVYHIYHTFHSQIMNVGHQSFKILQRTVFGIHSAIILDRIRTAKGSLSGLLSNGVDGEQPDHINAQSLDTLQVTANPLECPLIAMISNKYGVHDLIPVSCIRSFRHKNPPFSVSCVKPLKPLE